VAGIKAVYKVVVEATEELIGALGSSEIKAIRLPWLTAIVSIGPSIYLG
jgi:hypothetical protein